MKTPKRINVDKTWLRQKLDQLGYTQAFVADKLGLQPAGVSRRMNGTYEFTLEEAAALADLIRVPYLTLIEKLGVALPSGTTSADSGFTPLLGTLAGEGFEASSNASAAVPSQAPTADAALRVYDVGPLDAATVYLGAATPAATCIGRLCYVEALQGLYVIRRGANAGNYTLVSPRGERKHEVALGEVRPALWVRL